jgi:hypothetical protein
MYGVMTWIVAEVKVDADDSRQLATRIAADVRFLPLEAKREIAVASPVAVKARLEELAAFQIWMDISAKSKSSPIVVRAQVVTQNYICFVYLPEACFSVLAKHAPTRSATRKCARFLCDDRIRAFRNAVAHANWSYRNDLQALIYWARKRADKDEPLTRFEVE